MVEKKVVYIGLLVVVGALLVFAVVNLVGLLSGGEPGLAPFDATVTVSNAAPTIVQVDQIGGAQEEVAPIEGSTRNVIFKFVAEDTNGHADLETVTATAEFVHSSTLQTTGTVTCTIDAPPCTSCPDGGVNQREFTCDVPMEYYYDPSTPPSGDGDDWSVTATIDDGSNPPAVHNSNTFDYTTLTAITIPTASISWSSVGVTPADVNQQADGFLTLQNRGNANVDIDLTGYNLKGLTTTTEEIPSESFTAGSIGGGAQCSATALGVTGVTVPIIGLTVNYGAPGGGGDEEPLYFCIPASLDGLGLSSQSYANDAGEKWVVDVI